MKIKVKLLNFVKKIFVQVNKILLIIITLILLTSCKKEETIYDNIKKNKNVITPLNYKNYSLEDLYYNIIYQVNFSEPDSTTLKEISFYEDKALLKKDSLHIYRANLLGIVADNNISLNDPRFSSVNKSINYFDLKKNYYDAYLANFVLAEMHLSLGYYKIAENYIFKTLENLEASGEDFAYEKILASMTASNILFRETKFDEAYEMSKTYEVLKNKIDKKLYNEKRIKFLESLYYNNLAVFGNFTKKITPEENIKNIHKSLKMVDENEAYQIQRGTANFNAFIFKLRNKDTDSLEYYLNEFVRLREPFKNQPFAQANYAEIPLYYLEILNDTAKAISYQKELINQNKQKNNYNLISKKLYEQLILKSDSFSIDLYKDYLLTLDKIKVQNESSQKINQKTVYNNLKIARANKKLKKENSIIIVFILFCSLLLVLLLLNFIQGIRYKKIKIRNNYLEQDQKAFELTLAYKTDIDDNLSDKKKEIFMEIHDGVVNKIFSIRFLLHKDFVKNENLEIAKNALIDVKENLHNISNNYIAMNEIFHTESFATILTELVNKQPNNNTTFVCKITDSINWQMINPNVKFHVYRIVQELLQNIHKHSKATLAQINIFQRNNDLIFTVSDNGLGINSDLNKGIGFSNIQKRLDEINGEIYINTQNGTEITLCIHL